MLLVRVGAVLGGWAYAPTNARQLVRASFLGVGAPEAFVIAIVSLLVFGPKGLAEVRFCERLVSVCVVGSTDWCATVTVCRLQRTWARRCARSSPPSGSCSRCHRTSSLHLTRRCADLQLADCEMHSQRGTLTVLFPSDRAR